MELSSLTALSPLDGRYANKLQQLRPIVSEYGLIFYRLRVEIDWLIALAQHSAFTPLSPFTREEIVYLESLMENFNETEAQKIKVFETITNHDVKAIEYYLREKCEKHSSLKRATTFVHFACTSEDINNLAYALMIKTIRDTIFKPAFERLLAVLNTLISNTANSKMLSRTHGQVATPTTLGKEFKNFAVRLETHMHYWLSIPIAAKCNGAVGNFNAHLAACPTLDWLHFSEKFVHAFGFRWNAHTTQIEPHDFLAQWLNALTVCHTILLDLSRDCWGYISLNYLTQKKIKKEVGSSTMPHKINPIDFENAEGNLGLAIALSTHLSQKLPISRFQRDLSDSTVLRNLGSIAGYALLAYESLEKGLSKIIPNNTLMANELDKHPELLTEAIQTVMRYHGIIDAYEQLKNLSRGEQISLAQLHAFIDTLSIPDDVKAQLKTLRPEHYLGLAETLAKQ